MDPGDLVKLLLIVLIVVVPAVSQILAKIREQQQQPPPGRAPRPARPPRPVQEDVKQEIEDFLRRASESREAKRPGPRPAQGPPRRKPAAPPPAPPKPAEAPPAPDVSVLQHVKKYMDSAEFATRAQKLGDEVALADDKLDARLREVFQHEVSEFDWRTQSEIEEAGEQPVPSPAAAAAAGFALLLANPENLRQAIVLSEILQPPAHRWT